MNNRIAAILRVSPLVKSSLTCAFRLKSRVSTKSKHLRSKAKSLFMLSLM